MCYKNIFTAVTCILVLISLFLILLGMCTNHMFIIAGGVCTCISCVTFLLAN